MIHQESPRSVYLHLISQQDMSQCSFWVGIFHRGPQQPQDLFKLDSMDAAFEIAAKEGLAESGPMMMSDCAIQPPRFLFFMPEPPHDLRKKSEWTQQLVDTIASWAPQQVGIYLSPRLVNQKLMTELISETLRAAISKTQVKDYYLQTTTHGLNAILNTSLSVKRHVDHVDTFVFH